MPKSKVILTQEIAELFPDVDFPVEGIPLGSDVVFEVYSFNPAASSYEGNAEDTIATTAGSPDDAPPPVVGGGEKPPRP